MINQPIHVLFTRPLSGESIDRAAAEGIIIDTLSFISTMPVADEDLDRRIRDLAARPLVAVFTSMNAVDAVTGWLQKVPETWRIFCISEATRRSVANYFGEEVIKGTAESSASLAECISGWEGLGGPGSGEAGGPGSEVFFFCGDHRRDDLPSILRRQGITVNECIVYRTMQTPHLVHRVYDGIAFFSPSAVESFFSVNTVTGSTPLFAIGPTTAAAIGARCSNPVIIGDQPDKEALIQKMIGYFSNKRKDKASDDTQE